MPTPINAALESSYAPSISQESDILDFDYSEKSSLTSAMKSKVNN